MMDYGSISNEVKEEYEKFVIQMNPPRVLVDNNTNEKATLILVDSINKHGSLLQVVQVLNDLNLMIKRAYVSTDGEWRMDVFHVVDEEGNKLYDSEVVERIQQSLSSRASTNLSLNQSVEIQASSKHTSLELIGNDRPGLLSEIFAVLTKLKCNIVAAEAWTHKSRMALVIHITDQTTLEPIDDFNQLSKIQNIFLQLFKGGKEKQSARIKISMEAIHAERRLHQMMYEDRDFDGKDLKLEQEEEAKIKTVITVENYVDRGYSLVYVRSKDRPKLVFDTVCTLIDMQYVVFHATVNCEEPEAYQEYYIRHIDGHTVNTEGEKQRLIICLEAAINRRSTKGLKLELRSENRIGILSDLTRIFQEHGIWVIRAEVSTREPEVLSIFYVTDASGDPIQSHTIESVKKEIGKTVLSVKDNQSSTSTSKDSEKFSFRNLFKFRFVKFFFSLCFITFLVLSVGFSVQA